MKNRIFSTKDVVVIGMMIALNMIALTIKIPYGNGAMVHLGTASVFALAIAFGGIKGGLAGGLSACMFDLMAGFPMYALWSLVAKGGAGFIAGGMTCGVLKSRKENKVVLMSLIGCLLAALWTLAIYFQSWVFIIGSVEAAVLNIPSSIISSGVGMALGIPLGLTMRRVLPKHLTGIQVSYEKKESLSR